MSVRTASPRGEWGLALRLFCCFAFAYMLSWAYRVVNALIGADLARDLGLSASDVGLLTAVYFLSFAALQLPAGLWLDRFESRKVEALLVLAAAAGALLFAVGDSLWTLTAARLLIGAGVSVCLMAAFRAYASWLSRDLQASFNLWMLVAGSGGAMLVTSPAEVLVAHVGWRGLFCVLAGLTVAASAVLWFGVPRPQPGLDAKDWHVLVRDLVRILRSLAYWRLAPLGFFQHGGLLALQGLWIGLWLAEVHGMPRAQVAPALFVLNLALLGAYFVLGVVTPRLKVHGIEQDRIYAFGMAASQATLLAILVVPGADSLPAWVAMGALCTVAQLSYTMLGHSVPVELAGRTSVSLNLAVFVGAFLVQWGLGAVVDALRLIGVAVAPAYRVAMGCLLAAQAVSFGVFLWATRRQSRRADAPGPR